MRRFTILIAGLMVIVGACGSVQELSDAANTASNEAANNETDPQAPGDTGAPGATADGQAAAPEPSGDVAMDTIRIGNDVWSRTLPMTTGQCFVFEDDGTLPTSGTVWGTLDGDDELRFAARLSQDGTFEAEISNDSDMYWLAGERAPDPKDLSIELDFENLTITGSGTFYLANTGELASGSFAFQCEEE